VAGILASVAAEVGHGVSFTEMLHIQTVQEIYDHPKTIELH
jgi:hypothetical protein